MKFTRIKEKIRRATASALAAMMLLLPCGQAYAAQVEVTVEKLVLGEGFIIDPTLVTVPDSGKKASLVIEDLIYDAFPNVGMPIKYNGGGSTFYVQGIWDPSRNRLLTEFDPDFPTFSGTGWMLTVENVFIGTSAGARTLRNGDVMRWMFTKQYGNEFGINADNLGTNGKADKDDLVWKVAVINDEGSKSDYGSAYTNAMSVLAKLNASQSEVDNALAALENPGQNPNPGGPGANPDDPGANPDGPGNPGTGQAPAGSEITATVVVPEAGAGVEAGQNPQYVTAEEIGAIAPGKFEIENGVAMTKTTAVVSGLSPDDARKIDAATVTPLPIFSAGVSSGGTAVVSIKVSLDKYDGARLGDVAMLKLKRDGSAEPLAMAADAKALKAASFIWTDMAGQPKDVSGKIVAGRSYYLNVAITDDSEYDLDATPGKIIDPLAMASTVTPQDDGGSNNDDDAAAGDSSGGGCSTGGSAQALFGLLCLAAIAPRRTRRSS